MQNFFYNSQIQVYTGLTIILYDTITASLKLQESCIKADKKWKNKTCNNYQQI